MCLRLASGGDMPSGAWSDAFLNGPSGRQQDGTNAMSGVGGLERPAEGWMANTR